jgi:OTU domain-containing protein 6
MADQLNLTQSSTMIYDYVTVRKLIADHMRQHADLYAPFLGLDVDSCGGESRYLQQYEEYCYKVESASDAEWGGQLEITALCDLLRRQIWIYKADSPVLIMGEANSNVDLPPLRLVYHRYYYALGEHYNSVKQIEL